MHAEQATINGAQTEARHLTLLAPHTPPCPFQAAATVFTMNNLQYAITAIDSSASLAPVPAEWLETQRATVRFAC